MAASETVTIGETKFTAIELTVKQIKEMMEGVVDSAAINNIIDTDIPAEGVALACGVTIGALEEHLPSDLKKIWGAVEKINPSLAGMARNTTAVLEQLEQLSKSLPAVSADSSS